MSAPDFKPGDRIVGLSGYTGTVGKVDGDAVTVTLDGDGGTGDVHRRYLTILKAGVVPHGQGASTYVH
ncbi:preprotein translocase subunit YajC [Mesorhizobium sp. M0152]|uniref:hypothetical protein n=1 Tax=Mesorhizobium sp. M0152 TaxID=2956898 RepID=UPI00333618DD